MTASSLFYWQEKLAKSDPRELVLEFKITGAKTVVPVFPGLPVLTAFDAIAAQSTIDNYLGTTTEFNVLAFDATSMGTDAFAGIIDMKGQVAAIGSIVAKTLSGANGLSVVESGKVGAGLTNTTLELAYALGANGNLAFKTVLTGVDALTSGLIQVRLTWLAK